ncbi:unnamed protein product [Eruca vesicaria subsp. sativa]|uniref:non-specific serine/threonine protein kinase n=1 Tax=Eruca vesicaria subsp. sativa TaxID=29727 RepID=A0ABC8JD61_ERUVS|nr:unnamed protein product [Eruca vesicaria subsp. sativa]
MAKKSTGKYQLSTGRYPVAFYFNDVSPEYGCKWNGGGASAFLTDPARTTDMSITVRMNSEDHTIFLQVQISDGSGYMRNIHFPFSIVKDTPLEVALEMVKELEITDWDSLEIAAMIENEISLLVPNWSAHEDPSLLHQSFGHEDDDDNGEGGRRRTRPFYSDVCSPDPTVSVKHNNNNSHEDPSLMHQSFGHEDEGGGRSTRPFYSAASSLVAVKENKNAHEDPSLLHHSFGYEVDDDNGEREGQKTLPFYSASCSPDPTVVIKDNNNPHEDPSFQHQTFGHEDDDYNVQVGRGGKTSFFYSAACSPDPTVAVTDNEGSSNDGGSGRGSSNTLLSSSTYQQHSPPVEDDDQNPQRRRRLKLHKLRSLVDKRTQVLHRSLMELINRHARRGRGSNMNLNELQHQPVADFL